MKASQAAAAALGAITMPRHAVASNTQQSPPLLPREGIPRWEALGCYDNDHALQNHTTKADMVCFTIGSCKDACFSDGFQYAGTTGGNQCWCGTYVGSSKVENQDCDTRCPGYPAQFCGGINAMNIFRVQTGSTSTQFPTSSSNSNSANPSSTSSRTTQTSGIVATTISIQPPGSTQPTITSGVEEQNS